MKDIRIDAAGDLRCWNCGSKHFNAQRTLKSKVGFGVGALLVKPKMRCIQCGKYNDTGSAKPYREPAAAKTAGKPAGGDQSKAWKPTSAPPPFIPGL